MDDAFIEIDKDGISKSLRLEERGKERGEIEVPAADETSFDVVEADIVSMIGNELNRSQVHVRNQVQAYGSRLSDLHLLYESGSIRAAAVKASGDFDTLVIDWRNRLSNRKDDIRQSYQDLTTFRSANGLDRPAHDKPSSIVTSGSIALSALVEVIGNAMFLKVNDELGYLGGVVAAFMIALINIGVGVLIGRAVWPRTHLKSQNSRRTAWGAISLWIIFLIIWNLFAAHFRDAKSEGLADPQAGALQSLINSPFGLDGIYSWGLLIIGIAAALIAARAAYRADDPFPGYGERDRHHRQRCDDYAAEVAEANRAMTEVRDDAINDATDVKRQLGTQSRERERIQTAYGGFARRFDEHQDRLEQAANYLLTVYRDANKRHRTEPSPGYFKESYRLARSSAAPLHIPSLREEDVAHANAALDACIDEVAVKFREAINALEPIDQLKAELERGTL